MLLKAYASGGGGTGSQNRPGSGENYTRDTSLQRRGNESMSSYYNRVGQSALGGNARTRGRQAPIQRVR